MLKSVTNNCLEIFKKVKNIDDCYNINIQGRKMKKCYKCGKVVAANENNCPYCGVTLLGLEYCPKCNSKLQDEPEFCSNCGTKIHTICRNCKKKLVGNPKMCPYCNTMLR